MTELRKWGKTGNFANNVKHLRKIGFDGQIFYVPKVKLDGTNASIQIHPDGTLVTQSRNRIITPTDDNYGFSRWVESKRQLFQSMAKPNPFTIYGEWCGKGIQDRTAISQIDKKIFAVFGVTELTGDLYDIALHVYDPNVIGYYLSSSVVTASHPVFDEVGLKNESIYVIPTMSQQIILSPSDDESVQTAADVVNNLVEIVEQQDPWVKEEFGISGLGEGVVLFPMGHNGVLVMESPTVLE